MIDIDNFNDELSSLLRHTRGYLSTADLVDGVHLLCTRIDPRLAIEISEPDKDEARQIIISANGISELFSTVEELVSLVPFVEGWQIIALKPPRGFDFIFNQDGNSISPSQWSFTPTRNKSNQLCLRILITGKRVRMDVSVLSTIIETGVGELAFAAIGEIEYTQSQDEINNGTWISINQLDSFLKWSNRNSQL